MLNKTNMLQTKKQNTQNKQCTTHMYKIHKTNNVQQHMYKIHKTNNVQHTCTKYTKQTMYNTHVQNTQNKQCTTTHVQNKAITKLVFTTNVQNNLVQGTFKVKRLENQRTSTGRQKPAKVTRTENLSSNNNYIIMQASVSSLWYKMCTQDFLTNMAEYSDE